VSNLKEESHPTSFDLKSRSATYNNEPTLWCK